MTGIDPLILSGSEHKFTLHEKSLTLIVRNEVPSGPKRPIEVPLRPTRAIIEVLQAEDCIPGIGVSHFVPKEDYAYLQQWQQ